MLTCPPAGDAPRWVYFSCGAAALTYLHLDCIDGKQARRTKSSSPLGQLFDHGARRSVSRPARLRFAAPMQQQMLWFH